MDEIYYSFVEDNTSGEIHIYEMEPKINDDGVTVFQYVSLNSICKKAKHSNGKPIDRFVYDENGVRQITADIGRSVCAICNSKFFATNP